MGFLTAKIRDLRVTRRDTREGRSGIENLGLANGALYERHIVEVPGSKVITGATGSEDGVCPGRHITGGVITVFGDRVVSTQAQFDALTAAQKAEAVILSDEEAPIGTICVLINFAIGTGAVDGASIALKTAANTWSKVTTGAF